jgi:transposase
MRTRLPAAVASPDFNPIEQAFSKLKSYLRAACARSQDTLMEVIGKALSTITVSDALGYFEHCGYRRVVHVYDRRSSVWLPLSCVERGQYVR